MTRATQEPIKVGSTRYRAIIRAIGALHERSIGLEALGMVEEGQLDDDSKRALRRKRTLDLGAAIELQRMLGLYK